MVCTSKNLSSPPTRTEKLGARSRHTCLPAGREAAERGYIFWRIGERPILQKPHGLVIELPQTPWTFDLPRELPGTNQKIHLCDLSSAVKAIYFVLPLINSVF
jgi:hypothetical protein